MKDLQKDIHDNAVKHGWWDEERNIPELLCLMHSELSEALEAYRNKNSLITNYDWWANFKEELADTVIRVMDTCEHYDINLYEEILKKHEINKARPYRHGGKVC